MGLKAIAEEMYYDLLSHSDSAYCEIGVDEDLLNRARKILNIKQ